MDPYTTMARRLLTALGSTTLLAVGCGGTVSDEDSAPDTLVTGEGSGGLGSTGGSPNGTATGGATVTVATGGVTGVPPVVPTATSMPTAVPTMTPPEPPPNVC
jgi:hypothetical protein